MSKSLTKDTVRDIKKSFGRFMSILMISALGVAFFVGIKSAPLAMEKTVDQYYDDYNMMDLRLLSTFGFTDEDIKAIEQVEDIESVFPTYSQDVLTNYHDKELVLRLHALPSDMSSDNRNYINQVKVIEGRLPEKSGEAVVEKGIYSESLQIGSTITLQSGTTTPLSDTLKTTNYTIVGIVETPYYLSFDKGTTNIGNGKISSFMMIPQDDFKLEVYTEVFATTAGTKSLMTFNEEYEEAIQPIVDKIEVLSKTQTQIRYEEILNEATEELEKNRAEYEEQKADALAKLQEAADEIAVGEQKLADGKAELASKKQEFLDTIASAESQIAEGEAQLKQGEDEINRAYNEFLSTKEAASAQISRAEATIASKESELQQLETVVNQLKAALNNPDLSEEEKNALQMQLALLEQTYQEGLTALNSGKAELEINKQALIDGENKLLAAKRTILYSKQELETQKETLEIEKTNAYAEFEKAEAKIAQAEIDLQKGKQEYEEAKLEAETEFANAEEKLAEAETQIADLEMPEWFVLDRNKHYSFVEYKNAAQSIEAISKIFPIFFFMVAALVCLTTMTRMVDEQRMNIGTLKALGYGKVRIASKFLIYAALASVTGSIIGTAIGYFVFPTVVVSAYSMMYILPKPILVFSWTLVLMATTIAVGVTTLSAYFAVNTELIETPSILMRPKAPKEGKRILLERIPFIWNRLSFIAKVTVRNIFRYKKRFLMTIFGIAGCTALLLTGFGVKDSIRTIVDKQFGTIFNYDMTMTLNRNATQTERDEVISKLTQDSRLQAVLLVASENGKLINQDVTKDVTIFIPENIETFPTFINLQNRMTQQGIELPLDGAVITEKVANQLGVTVGDVIKVENGDGKQADVTVVGVAENYLSHYIYLSPTYYEAIFNKSLAFYDVLGIVEDHSIELENELSTEFMSLDHVTGISWNSTLKDSFDDTVENLNYVVLLMIISAGALAFVVLYNLTNVNISERMREIATIKVLGFYDNEVSAYIYRENIILTLIGTVAGLGLGILLHRYIMLTVEMDMMMFGREIQTMSYIYAAGLTLVFAALVNFAMYFKLKNVEMVESLKSVD